MFFRCWLAVYLFFCFGLSGTFAQNRFRVVTYNVENLFDCYDDPLFKDDEFTPAGEKCWTQYRYWAKLRGLSRAIAAIASDHLPDIVGLCEVENDSVLFDLTCRAPLRAVGYRYVVAGSSDRRGIRVALLYQPGTFKPILSRSVRVPSLEAGFEPTRNILYVAGQIQTGDTLHIMVCHLPSRSGRTVEANRHRSLAARTLCSLADSVLSRHPHAYMLAMGDFNASDGDRIFDDHLPVASSVMVDGRPVFERNENAAMSPRFCFIPLEGYKRETSYRYHGLWEQIDHIIVSPSLASPTVCPALVPARYGIMYAPFMCEPDPTYGGIRPFRTYQGPLYKGGISDHLPVVLDLFYR